MLEGIVCAREERWVYWSSSIRNVCTRRFVVILLMISLSTRKVTLASWRLFSKKDRGRIGKQRHGDDSDTAHIPLVPPLLKCISPHPPPTLMLTLSAPPTTPVNEDRAFKIPTIDYPPVTPAKPSVRPETQPSPKGPPTRGAF